jgi:hypothetical protein
MELRDFGRDDVFFNRDDLFRVFRQVARDISGKVALVMNPTKPQAANCRVGRESSILLQSIAGAGAFYV